MAAYSAPVGYVFSLNDGGRSGTFDVVAGDFSTELAADTLNGIYIGQADDPTATTKVAKRRIGAEINLKWFGPAGDEVTDDTAVIQSAFDFAASYYISKFVIPKGVYIVSSERVSWNRPNSSIYFEDAIFKHDDFGVELLGSVINFNADNLDIYNLQIDGDRANNIYDTSGGHGHQFNFSSYNATNVNLHGGKSINALQCQMQFTSSFRMYNMAFETAGEHHLYLTTAQDTAGADYAIIENCTFKDWAVAARGSAMKLNAYQYVKVDGCTIENDPAYSNTSGSTVVTAHTGRDTVTPAEEKIVIFTNCFVKNSTVNGLYTSLVPFIIDNCLLNCTVRGTKNTKLLNSTINVSSAYYDHSDMAGIIDNCTFTGGIFEPTQTFTMTNCEIRYIEDVTNTTYLNLSSEATVTGAGFVIKNNTFYDFDNASPYTNGIISCRGDTRDIIISNNFINCGATNVILVGQYSVVSDNHDVSRSGAKMDGNASNSNVYNNTLVDDR